MDLASTPSSVCPQCHRSVEPSARYCRHCGAALRSAPPTAPLPQATKPSEAPSGDEIVLPAPHRMRIEGDRISLRALEQMVSKGVEWWQMRVRSGEASRAEAAGSIEELSKALNSISQQLAQGRETIRITTRLPAQRRFPLGCPRCGKGNRVNARFCIACGRPFAAPLERPARVQRLFFSTGVVTDPGAKRSVNQDCALVQVYPLADGTKVVCGMVADGMGGVRGGERASRIAIQTLDAHLRMFCQTVTAEYTGWRDVIRAAIAAANSAVFREAERNPEYKGMGTTIVLVLAIDERVFVGNVGDSRVYLFNQAGVTDSGATSLQLTVDHTIVARLVDLGHVTPEEALIHPRRHVLYRSVGVEATVESDVEEHPLEPGDRLLLCSDGVTNELSDAELSQIILKAKTPQQACEQLITTANQRGARDNVTALIISTGDS